MRQRDADLYNLSRQGYRLSVRGPRFEVWAKPDDPDDTVVIPANPPMPESVRRELVRVLSEDDTVDANGDA